ncbi:hypothetical protein [Marinoscillum sp.]|uniref:hypothetical protein n=1 Tax=Marinoscillum sp. TaxID=2024838 RepID=UPI003BA9879A
MTNQEIIRKATQLALKFTDESEIPVRYKKKSKKKFDPDSKIEINFQEQIQRWKEVIESILTHINDPDQALRFIDSKPIVEDNLATVTKNQDFLDFLNFLIQRRDVDNCGSSELGSLCMLHGVLQKKIESQIES